jgi:hypothetical protein
MDHFVIVNPTESRTLKQKRETLKLCYVTTNTSSFIEPLGLLEPPNSD